MKSYGIPVSKISAVCVKHSDVADSARAVRVSKAIALADATHPSLPSFAVVLNDEWVRFWATLGNDVDGGRDLACVLRELTQPSEARHD